MCSHQPLIPYLIELDQPHPSRNARRSPATARGANRVLPTPPTPVSVTSREAASSRGDVRDQRTRQ